MLLEHGLKLFDTLAPNRFDVADPRYVLDLDDFGQLGLELHLVELLGSRALSVGKVLLLLWLLDIIVWRRIIFCRLLFFRLLRNLFTINGLFFRIHEI